MNRNYPKALLLLAVTGCLAASAVGQKNPLPYPPPVISEPSLDFDWVINCEDPTSTTSPYSTDWGIEYEYDALFGAVQGVSGTVNYSKYCFPPSGMTIPMAGRLGFYVGSDPFTTNPDGTPDLNYGTGGSTQDNIAGTVIDDAMGLTFGDYTGVAGNFSIAKIFQGPATGTTYTGSYFGQNAIILAYWGASDRYFVVESVNTDFDIRCRVDVIGDAARVDWLFTNQAAAADNMYFWFGQWVLSTGVQGAHSFDYITVPGGFPINVDSSFAVTPGTLANGLVQQPLPPYLDYGIDQSNAYGLQIVLQQSSQIPDQTNVDSIDVGYNLFLLGSMTASDGAMPDLTIPDSPLITADDAYIEKWASTQVGAAGSGQETREIIAYYRGTWSTADYSKPYSVVLDAPPVIATPAGNPTSFSNANPFFSLTVDIDDTRGFSTNDQSVPLEGVEIDLDLPPGMTDANNAGSNHLVKYLQKVPPQTVEHVTFQVAVDGTLFGNQQYTVTVIPNPGPTKVLTGTIVVASQPYLQLTGTANLVTAPWQFASGDWATIIGTNSGLVLDRDYQVFGWDPLSQDYELQTDPQRGYGSFIVSNQNVGFVALGGSPTQVQDLQQGAPQIILQPGWNLVANPYNYPIEIGQIVGVPEADNQNTYTFSGLASSGYISGYLAYWDPFTEGYSELSDLTDLVQPNTGYWIYVQSDLPVTFVYPPVFQTFIPGIPDGINSPPPKKRKTGIVAGTPTWTLQLAARSNGMVDGKTTVGQASNAQQAKLLTHFKAPMAPIKNAISSAIVIQNGKKVTRLGQALTAQTVTNQTWEWDVNTTAAGPVTLTWPNLSSVPSNISFTLTDEATGASENLRKIPSYSFEGTALGNHKFKLAVKVGASLPVIENLSVITMPSSARINYTLSVDATTTVTIQQNGTIIATLVGNRQDSAGNSSATWLYRDSANRPVKHGTYQAVVTSTPAGGDVATKSATILYR